MAYTQNPALYQQSVTILPLQPIPNQTTAFTINGETYDFLVTWNSTTSCWYLDITDSTGVVLAAGLKLAPDLDLLAGLRELKLRFGSCLVVLELNTGDYQTFDNLGTSVLLGMVQNPPEYGTDLLPVPEVDDKSTLLYPTPRLSNGLSQASFDLLGGEALEEMALCRPYTVNADKKIIIPAADGGGNVTYLLGIWDHSVTWQYALTASIDPAFSGDRTNYKTAATNKFEGGILFTELTCPAATIGQEMQVSFSRRTGGHLVRGESYSGWPCITVPTFQGCAPDGDMQMMSGLWYAYLATNDNKYRYLAQKIGNALISTETMSSGLLNFITTDAIESSGYSVYQFASSNADWIWEACTHLTYKCLHVSANVSAGGTPSRYAGWGNWASWLASQVISFNGLSFSMCGDGSGRLLDLRTNVKIDKGSDGEVRVLVPLFPEHAGQFIQFDYTMDDFWSMDKLVYSATHKDFEYSGCSGSNTYTLDYYADVANFQYLRQFTYDFSSNSSGYASMYFGESDTSSAGTTATVIEIYSVHAGKILLDVKDGNDTTSNRVARTLVAGWNTLTIPWDGVGGFSAPIATVTLGGSFDIGDIFTVTINGTAHVHTVTAADSYWLGGIAEKIRDLLNTQSGTLYTATSSGAVITITQDLPGTFTVTATAVNGGSTDDQTAVAAISTPTAFVHPAGQFGIAGYQSLPANTLRLKSVVYDAPVTATDVGIEVINGYQFGFPTYDAGEAYDIYWRWINLDIDLIDGPAEDPDRYNGIARYVYIWSNDGQDMGYGSWRGPSLPGYMHYNGFVHSGLRISDGRYMVDQIRQFLLDAQDAWKEQFPSALIGPFMTCYGRPSWECLTIGGYVENTYQENVYNQWYYSGLGSWYGGHYRALHSVAMDYFYSHNATCKTILDRWMTWLDTYLIADGSYWQCPTGLNQDGSITYDYRATFPYMMIAAACIYKYWVDGDVIAQKWYRRLLDDAYARSRHTATGTLAGISRTAEGSGYTTATVTITGDGEGAAATAHITAGKVRFYTIDNAGSGYTWINAVVSGDGEGAVCTAYMSDALLGAYGDPPLGWELAECYNTLSLLVNGGKIGGTVVHALPVTANDRTALQGIQEFYFRNMRDSRPAMCTSTGIPFSDFDIGPWNNGNGLENPINQNYQIRSGSWTESIGPTITTAVEYGRNTGSWTWLENLYKFVRELTNT